ncbi:hypothetical protein CHU98_g6761 [Xylaria longipes]|nr:hypothetical protein CHU98_g6761 [Xylaria longipes]
MARQDGELDPLWQDLDWAIGQMLIMGWDATEVTPPIRNLIENHHLGSIILTAKNLKSAEQTAALVQELQTIAHQAGHPQPLLIAVDQENGGVNSLFDEDYICQFPSAMGIAATGSPELAYSVAKATATEISAVGVNLILGPVLDVLTNARHQPLGVRTTGDDPQEASQYCIATINGYKDAGMATCGKHFPSYGNLDFLGSSLDMPIITQTLEELSLSALVPFRNAVAAGRLDAMFIGGCGIQNAGMNVTHACLSDQVVDDLLRNDLGFKGVAISECLEMQSLIQEYGVKGGTVMAVEAGNDLILLCRARDIQLEAISGLKLGIENGIISKKRIYTSLRRVLKLKNTCTSWEKALHPPGLSLLSKIHPSHLALSQKAYDQSITVVRDKDNLLPLSEHLLQGEELLLLTPLVKPLPASAATKNIVEKGNGKLSSLHERWAHFERGTIMSGEGVFRELGKSLARIRNGKLLHTSYTANGLRPVHENLINRASAIIIVTADANRNMYQNGFTKHVATMCHMLRGTGQKKSLIVVAVSSPYDFAMEKTIGTYVCTFDFTETAMASLVRALYGEIVPQGSMPGTMRKSKKMTKTRQQWLVENYERSRDEHGLNELLRTLARSSTPSLPYIATTAASFGLHDSDFEESHFVVRNSSTNTLYGFVATYFLKGVAIIGAIFVDPSKRNVSIGRSLHRRAMRSLLQKPGIKKIQLGLAYPGIFPGVPVDESGSIRSWFDNVGWDTQFPKRLANMVIEDLGSWSAPEGLLQSLQRANISFDLIKSMDNSESVLALVAAHSGPEIVELYRSALRDQHCGVVRAKAALDNVLGIVIICNKTSQLSAYIPSLYAPGNHEVGGIIAPIVPAASQSSLILQGLVFMGVRQNKSQKSAKSVLSWVPGETHELFSAMGFEVQQTFDEVVNSPEHLPTSDPDPTLTRRAPTLSRRYQGQKVPSPPPRRAIPEGENDERHPPLATLQAPEVPIFLQNSIQVSLPVKAGRWKEAAIKDLANNETWPEMSPSRAHDLSDWTPLQAIVDPGPNGTLCLSEPPPVAQPDPQRRLFVYTSDRQIPKFSTSESPHPLIAAHLGYQLSAVAVWPVLFPIIQHTLLILCLSRVRGKRPTSGSRYRNELKTTGVRPSRSSFSHGEPDIVVVHLHITNPRDSTRIGPRANAETGGYQPLRCNGGFQLDAGA